jgi:hypothetical protein
MPERNLNSIAFPVLDEEQIAPSGDFRNTIAPKFYRDGYTLLAGAKRSLTFSSSGRARLGKDLEHFYRRLFAES